jgi:hypothetical protein
MGYAFNVQYSYIRGKTVGSTVTYSNVDAWRFLRAPLLFVGGGWRRLSSPRRNSEHAVGVMCNVQARKMTCWCLSFAVKWLETLMQHPCQFKAEPSTACGQVVFHIRHQMWKWTIRKHTKTGRGSNSCCSGYEVVKTVTDLKFHKTTGNFLTSLRW